MYARSVDWFIPLMYKPFGNREKEKSNMKEFVEDCKHNRGMVAVYLGLLVCAGWLLFMASWDLGGQF